MKKSIVWAGIGIVIAAIALVYLITISNDHAECGVKTSIVTDAQGNSVTRQEHICKEPFSI